MKNFLVAKHDYLDNTTSYNIYKSINNKPRLIGMLVYQLTPSSNLQYEIVKFLVTNGELSKKYLNSYYETDLNEDGIFIHRLS